MIIDLAPAMLDGFDARLPIVSRGIELGFDDLADGTAALSNVLETIEGSPRPAPWSSYWALSRSEGCYVGLCAFKAPPADGVVEIAYYTYPKLEGRGIAGQMAEAQIVIARSHNVQVVRAHTLPETNASASILKRLCFIKIGDVFDPDDGLVWRWERSLIE